MIYKRLIINYLVISSLLVGCKMNNPNLRKQNAVADSSSISSNVYSKFSEIKIFKGYVFKGGIALDVLDGKNYGVIEAQKDSSHIISLVQCFGSYLNENISIIDTLRINKQKDYTIQLVLL